MGRDPDPSEVEDMTVTAVALDLIDAGPNDRKHFDAEALAELAASIKEHGLAQPPTLRPVGDRFEIVAGERRTRACRLLGWAEIPALVREMSDADASAIMLAENVQRADLDPLEEARAYQDRMDRFGYSVAEVARLASHSESRVRGRLGLLALEESIAHMVSRGQFPVTYAAYLVPLDHNRQRLAVQAHSRGPLGLDAFRALCQRLQSEQAQDSFFDPASFLQVEDYVTDALQSVENDPTLEGVSDPVGVIEIAERLGVKQQTVSMWIYRGIFPEPRWEVSRNPAWEFADVAAWYRKRQEQGGRGIRKQPA